MDDLIILNLADGDEPEWDQVEALFRKMYHHMLELGLMLPLDSGGSLKWISSARNTAGKFGKVVVAKSGDQVVAFAHGMIKFLPDYLGGDAVGIITHIFVDKSFRDRQIGVALVENLEQWFRLKRVHSVELQVISQNADAMGFWTNLGYSEELRQYRKILQ
jgi:GNAT superfamily N-acetyltransferase